MSISKQITLSFFIIGMLMAFEPAEAQRRISYEQLASQQREQSIFFDYFTLPGSKEGNVQFIATFRVDYNLLPFKKTNDPDSDYNFFSPASMSIEVFKGGEFNPDNRKRRDDISIEGLEPVNRSFWRDTAYAENYAQTQSKNKFISGHLQAELSPGIYSYMLQFTRGEEVDGQSSKKRVVKILPYREKEQGNVLLAESYSGDRVKLLNFGKNVYYGKDFYTLVHLPGHQNGDRYELAVNEVNISERDTTQKSRVYSATLEESDIHSGIRPELVSDDTSVYLNMKKSDSGFTYALAKIPNSTLQNAVYQLRISRDDSETPVATSIFRSRWIEMPTSLLNVDIAIDMLRYIVDEKTLNRLKEGSYSEKEKKFREFWSKRDPTPKTEFNELMAEYYRRVDYAYEEFSTINVNGYNTDQGRIYIQYGPPNNIQRKFPPGEPAVEIWEYPERDFVFRAISGFGEFELVSR